MALDILGKQASRSKSKREVTEADVQRAADEGATAIRIMLAHMMRVRNSPGRMRQAIKGLEKQHQTILKELVNIARRAQSIDVDDDNCVETISDAGEVVLAPAAAPAPAAAHDEGWAALAISDAEASVGDLLSPESVRSSCAADEGAPETPQVKKPLLDLALSVEKATAVAASLPRVSLKVPVKAKSKGKAKGKA